MSSVKNPQEKKALRYERDRVSDAEYPHAERRNRPRARAQYHRTRRNKNRSLLTSVVQHADFESDEIGRDEHPPTVNLKISQSVPLGDDVARRLHTREARLAWNYFHKPYDSQRDRERFIHFLETLIEGGLGRPIGFAEKLGVLLDYLEPDPELPNFQDLKYSVGAPWRIQQHGQWLGCFLQDEPGWRARIREWVLSVLSGDQ